jgi:hypothetical protein
MPNTQLKSMATQCEWREEELPDLCPTHFAPLA